MACNYADGLSPYEHKGKLGLPEIFDDDEVVDEKASRLAEWIRQAKHVVVHTGAGISTAAGIPDFRGPKGVWTLEERGLKPEVNISFERASPTATHMGLAALVEAGYVKFIISQNIDGLHLRSGLKRNHIGELHGNMFVARCSYCEREFVLPRAVPTVGQKEIGKDCAFVKPGGRGCRGKLRDNILDWEHNLPDRDLEMADMHSTLADLSICLGTTLQIVPAGNMPLKAKKNGGKLAIVNLQPTKHHKKADLVIHAKVDKVIIKIAEILGVTIPSYIPNLDPTWIVQAKMEAEGVRNNRIMNHHHVADWTIPASVIKSMKKQVSATKPPKNPNPTRNGRNSRKRRRPSPKEEDNSSDEIDMKCQTVGIKIEANQSRCHAEPAPVENEATLHPFEIKAEPASEQNSTTTHDESNSTDLEPI